MKTFILSIAVIIILLSNFSSVFAHCNTMEGPVVKDAKTAIENNNVNFVLKWVTIDNESEIKKAFNLVTKVRKLSTEAQELADNYFFETLVRIHRAGEGVPYTGVKPAGTPIEEKILAADKSIELGNLSPLENHVPKAKMKHLKHLFERVMTLKNFDVNDVSAGREYIEAYVQFFHFAEGDEEKGHGHHQD